MKNLTACSFPALASSMFLFWSLFGLFLPMSVTLAELPTYRVGAILPLTGDGSSWGHATKDGMEIALSKLPHNIRRHIEIIYEDDAMQSRSSLSAFQRMTSNGSIDVLVNVTSGTGNALAPIVEKSSVTFFSIASDSRIAVGRSRVFMFYLSPDDEMRAALGEMKRRGYSNIAVLVAIQDGFLAGFESLKRLKDENVTVVFSEQFPPDVRDFRSTISKIRSLPREPDAILILLMPGQVGLFARQARELGLKVPLAGGINFESKSEIETSNGALLNQWYVANGDPTQDFLKEYKHLHPNSPLACATNGNDVIAMIAKAIEANIAPKDLPDFLRTLGTFKGASGEIRLGEDGHFQFPATIKVVTVGD